MMTIYTVVMLPFTVALYTEQKQWTLQIYIQGVTPTRSSNIKHKTKQNMIK
jgi:hypothetical protein